MYILVVEDDEYLRKMYEILLKKEEYKVETAANGKEAVEKFKHSLIKPQLILMDYRMPVMNGLDALQKILKLDDSARIIMISAERQIREKAFELGAIQFIDKPFKFKHLLSSVEKILREMHKKNFHKGSSISLKSKNFKPIIS